MHSDELIKKMASIQNEQKLTDVQLEKKSGVAHQRLMFWKERGAVPRLDLFCYVVEALGYEVVIKKKGAW